MDFTVNNETRTAEVLSIHDGTIDIVFSGSFSDAASMGETPMISVDGTDYNCDGLELIQKDGDFWRAVWSVEDPTEAELSTANSKLTAVSDAITALGDGVPTLAKLKTFLTAVKEAVGYGND